MSTEENNKAALKRFYEKKDPLRVKNVEPLFMRYEQEDILYYVERKYGEAPEGWQLSDGTVHEGPSFAAAPDNRKSQGGGLLGTLFGRKSMRKSAKSSQSFDHVRRSVDTSRASRDSEDSDAGVVRPASNSFKNPSSPANALHSVNSMAELKVDDAAESPRASHPTPSPSPPTVQQVEIPAEPSPAPESPEPAAENAETEPDVDLIAQLEEVKQREREALEQARAEEKRIQEALARGREAIERAKRELEEKEKELEDMRKKLAEDARRERENKAKEGQPVVANAIPTAAAEELKKAEEEVEKKQIETIGKLEEAEKERIILEEQNQLVKIEEAERVAKIQLIEAYAAPESKGDDEEKQEEGDVVAELPATSSNEPMAINSAPKRVTLYERKLQAALEAPTVAEEPAPVSSTGRKTLLGGLVSRLTVSARRKTVTQAPSPVPEPAPVAEESIPEPVAEEPVESTSEAPAAPAPVIPAPMIAPPTSVVTNLAVDELEQWKLRALEAESRSKMLQKEAEERARKFQQEAEERIRKLEEMAAAAFNRPQPAPAPAPVVATPTPAPAPASAAAPAPAASSGGAISEINGYKVLPKDHPDLNKFTKMSKAGLPQGAVENAMMREFIHPKSIYDSPLNDPKPRPAAAAAPAAQPASGQASSGGDDGQFKKLPQDSPDLEKYRKMQKTGLPQGAIENAMMRDFVHPASLFGASAINDPKPVPKKAPAAPAAGGAASGGGAKDEFKKLAADSPELEKYKKMQKTGLPQGAIENAMMRDFVHPASLFGSNAINDPKSPKGALGGAKAAPKPAPAAAAPAAAAPSDPSKPPPGMSMMEEMKWRQAQKAKQPPKQFVEPVKKEPEKVEPKGPAAPPGPNDKPPPGLSMMEEMKWRQAQKAAMAAAGKGPAPVTEVPKKAAPAPSTPAFKVPLKSTTPASAIGKSAPSAIPAKPATGPSAFLPKPATPAMPAWSKPPAKAVVQAAANLAAAPPPPNIDALVNLFVGAKISPENAKKYATALANEGFDAPDKLALLDENDLKACGITARFEIKTILSLKNNLPKTPAPAPAPATTTTAPKPGVPAASGTTSKPGISTPATAAKSWVPPSSTAKPVSAGGIPKPATTTTPAPAAKPGFAASSSAKPATVGGASSLAKPSIPASTGGFQRPALKNSADEKAKKDADRLAFVMALGAPTSAYKKPKQIG